jgi:hypothetical protein
VQHQSITDAKAAAHCCSDRSVDAVLACSAVRGLGLDFDTRRVCWAGLVALHVAALLAVGCKVSSGVIQKTGIVECIWFDSSEVVGDAALQPQAGGNWRGSSRALIASWQLVQDESRLQ